ncbi:MAG: hypothetical protein ABWY18_12620 [Tardiphaga sp.]
MIKRLTTAQWLQGGATFAAVGLAGMVSIQAVNQRFAANEPRQVETGKSDPAAHDPAAPCIAADGTWRNWSQANVPMLSPKCEDGK